MWFLAAAALAAPAERFPWIADVELPADGVQRIRVPAELRPTWSPDASGLSLLDGAGVEVPFASVMTDRNPEKVRAVLGSAEGTVAVEYWPSEDGVSWTLAVRDRPADGLEVLLPRTPLATAARLYEQDGEGWVLRAEQVVWRLEGGGVSAPISLPPRTGVFKLELDPPVIAPEDSPELTVLRHASGSVAETVLELDIVAQQVRPDGWVRYDVLLSQPLDLNWIEIHTDADLFDRRAGAEFVQPSAVPDLLPIDDVPYIRRSLQRTHLGGAKIDQVRIFPEGSPTRRLAIYIEAQGVEPLPVEGVTVGMSGLDLLVQDAGEGPHRLLGGAPAGTTPDSDLQFVRTELTRLASNEVIRVGPRRRNPTYQPPELRGGLQGPSSAIDLKPFSRRYPIEGGSGLVRIALTDEVLAHARPDLGDLRIVDPQGNQIPYLLEEDGRLHSWGELEFERTERGQKSVIEVPLPQPNVPVGVVTLSTEAPLFERDVELSRPSRGRLQTLRALSWTGLDRPSTVTIVLNQRVGATLVVQIDNGDDPPLPITSIEAAWSGWELVAVIPDGGASLVLGAPRVMRPDYDLSLLRDELRDRAMGTASLGLSEELSPPTLSKLDRGLVAFGVGIMALGLLGLTGVLIRGAPREPEPEELPEDGDTEAA